MSFSSTVSVSTVATLDSVVGILSNYAVLNQTKILHSSEFLSANNGSKLLEIAHDRKTVGTPVSL